MTRIADYMMGGGPHFVPLGRVPVAPPTATVVDTLRLMRQWGTQGVLVREYERRYSLMMGDRVTGQELAARNADPAHTPIGDFMDRAIAIELVDAGSDRDAAGPMYRGEGLHRVVGVEIQGELVGLLSESEGHFQQDFFAAASSYVCGRGHELPPPPPSVCWLDGTSIRLA